MDYDSPVVTRAEDQAHWTRWRRNAVIGYVVLLLGFVAGGVVQANTIGNVKQASEQIDQNTKTNQRQQVVFNQATCAIRDSANKQLAAIEKLRAATDAALDVASASTQSDFGRVDFRSLSRDVSNIKIEPVTVPPDVVCGS